MPERRTTTMDLLDRIRVQRREKRMSQSQLGHMLHMPQSQIARIEQGNRDVRLSTLLELSRALGLEPMLIPKQLVPAVQYMVSEKRGEANRSVPKLVGNEPEDADEQRK
jgi:transcriptional regulator with XRE-family HTH domain